MSRFQSQIFYGILVAVTGVLLFLLGANPSRIIQYAIASGIFLAAIFSFIASSKSTSSKLPLKYNGLQAIGMLVYGVAIFVYASTFERFISITMVFLLFFGIMEMLFGFNAISVQREIGMRVIVTRMFIGFLMTIGAVVFLGFAFHLVIAVLLAGILFFLSGVLFIGFANVTRNK
jgi:hypothetical protein